MKLILSGLFLFLSAAARAQLAPFCDPGTPGAQECEPISCAVCNLDGFTGTNEGYGPDPDNDIYGASHFCGLNTSIQYILFYAESTHLTISVSMNGCTPVNGIDLAVMPGCDMDVLDCIPGNGGSTNSLSANNLIIGNPYVLIINIDAIGICHYTIHVTPPTGTIPPNMIIPSNMSITGDFSVCPGATAIYQTNPPDLDGTFTWTGPPGTTINGAPSPNPVVLTNSSPVEVLWGSTGGQICVTGENNCGFSVTTCQNISVTPIPITSLPDLTICAEEAPAELSWGSPAYTTGTYQTTIPSYLGCDSSLQQKVTVLPPIVTNLSPAFLCPGDCINVCGELYCNIGSYSATCKAANGCDSVVNFILLPPNNIAHITGEENLNCAVSVVNLHSDMSPGTKQWVNASGAVLGVGDSLKVTTPGMYILEVSIMVQGHLCTVSDTAFITENVAPPLLNASGATLDCDSMTATLHAITNANPAMYEWTGPDGFASNLPNPLVDTIGQFIISVTNMNNGCSTIDTVQVLPCCHTFSGTLDALPIFICGANFLTANFHTDQMLGSHDSLFFILYSKPGDPLNSIIMTSASATFPFVPGVQQFDSTYYIAAVAAPSDTAHSIIFNSPCFSISSGEPVLWAAKPGISVASAPAALCKEGGCLDITFHFTGVPPFQFHFNIYQNGLLQFAQDDTSVTPDKTITVCTTQFNQPLGLKDLNFQVDYLQDARCNCGN